MLHKNQIKNNHFKEYLTVKSTISFWIGDDYYYYETGEIIDSPKTIDIIKSNNRLFSKCEVKN